MTTMVKQQLEEDWLIYFRLWFVVISFMTKLAPLLTSESWRWIFQDLEGVLVIVTRFFGGIHLGPDR